jgi:hypothetical protein
MEAFFCILLGGLLIVIIVWKKSRTKPQDREEGDRYPFDERDIYSPSKNGQDKNHKKSA